MMKTKSILGFLVVSFLSFDSLAGDIAVSCSRTMVLPCNTYHVKYLLKKTEGDEFSLLEQAFSVTEITSYKSEVVLQKKMKCEFSGDGTFKCTSLQRKKDLLLSYEYELSRNPSATSEVPTFSLSLTASTGSSRSVDTFANDLQCVTD